MKTVHLAFALPLLAAAVVAQAQPVKAPPLPPGSNMVRVEPGMNKREKERQVRAHQHKARHKRDFTRDDSMPATAQGGGVSPAAATGGNAPAANSGARPATTAPGSNAPAANSGAKPATTAPSSNAQPAAATSRPAAAPAANAKPAAPGSNSNANTTGGKK